MSGLSVRRALWLGLALTVLSTCVALASPIVLEGSFLIAGGASWDLSNDSTPLCMPGVQHGFAPVEDGLLNPHDDAFDGGLMLLLNGDLFVDPDGNGDVQGKTATAGPEQLHGLSVEVSATALTSSPTLRVLYRLKNDSGKARKRSVLMQSNMGSDADTQIEATSSGDKKASPFDRWIVTSDQGVEGDPVVTNVLWGRHPAHHPGLRVDKLLAKPEKPCEAGDHRDDILAKYSVTVPAHQARYVMFFAEMNPDVATAKDAAKKFNKAPMPAALLEGLSPKTKVRILNWTAF